MTYTPIEIDKEKLTLMGVPFPDLESLENISNAIGSCMFEGFQPTARDIEIIRDACLGRISLEEVKQILDKEFNHA